VSSGGDKTERATPRRREDARKEGQVAKSIEVNSAFAMFAAFAVLLMWGPHMWASLTHEVTTTLSSAGTDHHVSKGMLADLFFHVVKVLAATVGPMFGAMVLVAVVSNVLQVRFKFTPEAIKPRLKKLDPIAGFKAKFSISSVFELAKSVAKLAIIGLPATALLWSHRAELLALGAVSPELTGRFAASLVLRVGFVVASIYVVLAIADYIFQKHRFEKQLRMTKQEVKQEMRQQDMAPEIKAAQRRRQREAARKRMLADVPTADVNITNPTHFSIALKYDPKAGAPQVVAKGADLLALRIREIAEENGVPRVENRPLARQLYATVEVGQFIPAELFGAVAEVLAYVYRANQRRRRDWATQAPGANGNASVA
jgi:flagellar biosynthetic protein FlhB